MKAPIAPQFAVICALALSSVFASAKDKVVKLSECPEPVQAVVRHYQQQGTLEEIGMDEKKKAGGPAVYEAKFTINGGKRYEIHISPEGKVLQMEEKKPKS